MTEKAGHRQRILQLICLTVVLVIGLFLRVGTALGTRVESPVREDARDYVSYALNLDAFGIYSSDYSVLLGRDTVLPKPDAARPPAYPWLLKILLSNELSQASISRICYAQAWIAELTLLCSVLLAMELIGPWPGLLMGALLAISPHQSVYVGYLLTETFFGLAIMLALGAGVRALKSSQRRSRWIWACVAGVLFGLSCLIRPTLDQWVPFLVLLVFLWRPLRQFRGEIVMLALGFILMMSPWWIRNEITLHRMSDPGKMINTLHDGSYPDFMYEGMPQTFGYPYRFDPGTAQATSSWAGIYNDLKGKFVNHPWAMIRWYLFGKIVYFFGWSSPEGWGGIFSYPVLRSPWLGDPIFLAASTALGAVYIPLILCGLLGTWVAFVPRTRALFSRFQAEGIRFVALLHIFAIGVHLLGAPFARYSVPFRPITFTLAVFFVVWVIRYLRERQHSNVLRT
jgi:hypothetical protein